MDLFEHLRQFKKIRPDQAKAARRRLLIISTPQKQRWSVQLVLARILESGSAMAVAALLLVILGGGFSIVRYVERAGGLDPQSLKAEAQAIDMQIDLANLQYQNVPGTPAISKHLTLPQKTAVTSTPVSTSTPPDMSIDQALDALSNM